jgi:hypothetical protein
MTSPTELWEAMKSYGTGVIKGNSADTFGAPVDLINTAISPITKRLGIYSDDPVGGSKTFRRLLNQSVEDSNVAETAGSMLSVGGAAKAMIVGAARLGKVGKVDIAAAERMLTPEQKSGFDPKKYASAVYDNTGVYEDKGRLKSVISDAAAKVPMEAALDIRFGAKHGGYGSYESPMKIEDLISHPELFSLYPELKDIKVYGDRSLGANTLGTYYPASREIALHPDLGLDEIKRIALHELQHGVQDIEGFQKGGNVGQFIPFNPSMVQKKIEEARKSGDPNLIDAAERFKEIANKQINEGFNRYQNLGGEQEARYTEILRDFPLEDAAKAVKQLLLSGNTPSTFDTKPIRPLP